MSFSWSRMKQSSYLDIIDTVSDLHRNEKCNSDAILTILQRSEVDLLHSGALKDMRRTEYEYFTRRDIRKKQRAKNLSILQEMKVPMAMTYQPYPQHTDKLPNVFRRSTPLTSRQQLLKWIYSNSSLWNNTFQFTKGTSLPTNVVLKDSFLRQHEDDLCNHSLLR